MVITPEKYIERLNELLQKKMSKLQEILALTGKQTDAITEDGLDRLNKLIEEKQRKIDDIDQLDEEFETYYERLKSILGISRLDQLDALKPEDRAAAGAKQLKGLTAEILEIMRSISEIEQVNQQKSKSLLGGFSNEIRRINQGKMANNAYRYGPASAPSYFLDKKK